MTPWRSTARMSDMNDGKAKTRRNYVSLKAIDPSDGKLADVLLSHRKIDQTGLKRWIHVKELAYIVPRILRKPDAIFQGLREEGEDDWLCYVGTPDRSYRGEDGRHDVPWPDEVFLVFVNGDRVVYNWYWAKCDPDDRKLPIDYGTRLGRRAL